MSELMKFILVHIYNSTKIINSYPTTLDRRSIVYKGTITALVKRGYLTWIENTTWVKLTEEGKELARELVNE